MLANPPTRLSTPVMMSIVALLVAHVTSSPAGAQALQVSTAPVGVAPLGIDVTVGFGVTGGVYIAVANSGDNSVSSWNSAVLHDRSRWRGLCRLPMR